MRLLWQGLGSPLPSCLGSPLVVAGKWLMADGRIKLRPAGYERAQGREADLQHCACFPRGDFADLDKTAETDQ